MTRGFQHIGTLSEFRYRCATCEEIHCGLPDLGYDSPAQAAEVPESEYSTRVSLNSDQCILDDQYYFVRGVLEIPMTGSKDRFGIGVWTSLSKQNMELYVGEFDDPGRARLGPFFGWLCNSVPGYPDCMLLKCNVHIRFVPMRPLIELEPTDHPLSVDQRQGITLDRAIEIVEASGIRMFAV